MQVLKKAFVSILFSSFQFFQIFWTTQQFPNRMTQTHIQTDINNMSFKFNFSNDELIESKVELSEIKITKTQDDDKEANKIKIESSQFDEIFEKLKDCKANIFITK